MSLINQALRKAQQDRSPDKAAPAAVTTPPPSHIPARPAQAPSGMSPGLIVGLVIFIAVLIGVVAGLSVVLLKRDQPAPVTTTTQQPQSTTPLVMEQPIAAPSETPIKTEAPAVIDELRKAREAAEAQAAAEANAAEEAEAARVAAEAEAARIAAIKPSQDIIQWLGQSKVTGVRLSDTGSKVILNNEAYVVGETVHYGLGLKVLLIQEHRILFIDNNGKKYMKRL